MDPTVEQILAEYERRSADEAKIMHSQPEEFARRSQISADINRARDIIVNYRATYTRGSYAKAS